MEDVYTQDTPPQQSWFRRNIIWVIILGVGGACCLIFACVAGIGGVTFTALRSSEAVTTAVAEATSNAEVQAALGTPIETGWFITGSVESSGNGGTADVSIPLNGTNQSGTLYANGRRTGGEGWVFDSLFVETDDGQRIDLR